MTGGTVIERARTASIILRNLLVGGNVLAAARALSRPRQAVSYVQDCLFTHENLFGRQGFVTKHVTAELGDGTPLPIVLAGARATGASSWFGPSASYVADLVSLCQLCRIVQPRAIFEIGTLKGFTAYHFALNSAPDTRVYTLDLPPGTTATNLKTTVVDDLHIQTLPKRGALCFAGTPEADKIQCLLGDSAVFDFTPYHGRIDLFFIDGAHSYEYVKSDTEHALRCCRPGGVIAWHDAGRVGVNGVTRYLQELTGHSRICLVPGGSLAYMVKA